MHWNQVAARAVADHDAKQDPVELGLLLDVVTHVVRPRLIVEIGSWHGGSLHAWASTGAEVIGVTLPDTEHVLRERGTHGAEMVYGDTTDPATADQLKHVLGGRVPDLVFIDGDHRYEGAANDWRLAREIAPGAVIGLHDIYLHETDPECGVNLLWAQIKAVHPHMEIRHPGARYVMGAGLAWV